MHLVKRAQKFGLLPPLFGLGPKVNILFSCSDSAVLNNFPCQVSKVRLKNYPHDQVVLFQPLFLNLIHKHFFRVLSTPPGPFQELSELPSSAKVDRL